MESMIEEMQKRPSKYHVTLKLINNKRMCYVVARYVGSEAFHPAACQWTVAIVTEVYERQGKMTRAFQDPVSLTQWAVTPTIV